MGKLRTDDPDEEKKQKEFKSMLNKLTPNNQEKLLQKFLAVGITQAKTLRNLIDQACAYPLSASVPYDGKACLTPVAPLAW